MSKERFSLTASTYWISEKKIISKNCMKINPNCLKLNLLEGNWTTLQLFYIIFKFILGGVNAVSRSVFQERKLNYSWKGC